MSFKFTYDSNPPPSTPGKSRSLFSNVSMTPAGAPPSASNSFTPQGPPPSTVFGSSQMSSESQNDSPRPFFSKSDMMNDSIFGSSIASPSFAPSRAKTAAGAKKKPFEASQSFFGSTNGSRFGESSNWGASNGFGDSQMEEDAEYDEEEQDGIAEEEEEERVGALGQGHTSKASGVGKGFLESQISDAGPPQSMLGQRKPIYSNPTHAKRPKLDERWASQSPLRKAKLSPKKASNIPSVVRTFAARSRIATVDEPSNFIIQTEDEISRMYDEVRQAEYGNIDIQTALSQACGRLSTVWKTPAESNGALRSGTGIALADHASNVAKASFLGSLLLQLHHPPIPTSQQGGFSGPFTAPRAFILGGPRTNTPAPVPKFLLDWLDVNRAPQSADIQTLKQFEPNPTASPSFWEILNITVLRGHLSEAADVLRSADFNYARSALEDGLPQSGYRGAQLQNIQRCINKTLQILESCPGTQHDDWDVRGAEWALYRKRVLAAVTDLEEFAEGDEQPSAEPPAVNSRFQAINFGLGPNNNLAQDASFTQSARMAESKVPWTIYQSLRSLYRIVLGDPSAIMNHAQSWVEATVGLTVWWDGEDDEGTSHEFGASTAMVFRPRAPKSPFDSRPEDAYLRRLDLAFNSTTNSEGDEAGFRINSLSGLEVGLASVFEGNVEGVLELLRTWSLCVASAVAEVASVGGWLETGSNPKPLSGLGENDLMVLSYGQDNNIPARRIRKDDVLSAYASGLFERRTIENESGARVGWELALEVLSRLDDNEKMQTSVSELLDKLPLDTAEQMDKVVLLCAELGLEKEGRRVSERYGDLTVSNSEEYGLALVCYARAHSRRKVKSVVDLLISYSLVQSRAYPASTALDEQLKTLVREPKACLSAIAAVDEEAATILQFYFSGYATLRRFYEIRDEAIGLPAGQRPRYKPLARRRAAAQALVAAIGSAADSIYGGLFDPDRDSAIQVDGLLALLGEALPLMNQSTPILSTSQQFAILSAIEDLETVTPRVYAQCEECFRSTLLEYHSSKRASSGSAAGNSYVLPPSPRALLKKSVSSLTASSTFSFIGSDMLESARRGSPSGSAEGSGVLVPRSEGGHEREWDWRAGLGEDAKGEDVLWMLRLGLANGLSLGGLEY